MNVNVIHDHQLYQTKSDMEKNNFSRRRFITGVSLGTAAAVTTGALPVMGNIPLLSNETGKLAILGGTPVVKNKVWPAWPYVDEKMVEEIVKTARSGIWCRIQSATGTVANFEKAYARLMGTRFAVGTGSGSNGRRTRR